MSLTRRGDAGCRRKKLLVGSVQAAYLLGEMGLRTESAFMWVFLLLSLERTGGDLLSFLLPYRITVFENYTEKKKLLASACTLGICRWQTTESKTDNGVEDFAGGGGVFCKAQKIPGSGRYCGHLNFPFEEGCLLAPRTQKNFFMNHCPPLRSRPREGSGEIKQRARLN